MKYIMRWKFFEKFGKRIIQINRIRFQLFSACFTDYVKLAAETTPTKIDNYNHNQIVHQSRILHSHSLKGSIRNFSHRTNVTIASNSRINYIRKQQRSNMANKVDIYYDTALKYTKYAGKLIREKVSEHKSVEQKASDIDLVTETDQQVEKLLIENLSKEFPDHQFIGEESVANGSQCNLTESPTWIIDPIDGTMNFIHGFPHSCVSIALFINKTPEIGIVYNPVLEQLFTARKGKGAFLNGKQIKVSGENSLGKALVMMEFGTSRDPQKLKVVAANQETLMNQVHGLRALGSAALDMAMVALGAADAYFEFGIHIWDIAAGELLVTEAGGVIMDPSGGPVDRLSRRVLVASSQQLAEQLTHQLVQFHPLPRD